MRIQHNIAALNSHRQLTTNNSSVSKNLEKLSSGYRINRAGDDAAGLAISEKMRAQITGLNTASKNAQDGISLVQTAEGALTEVHSMLNRMTELAGQAANGTYQDDVDRENTMKEMVSLRSEIDRISKGTNYNGIKLLDGSMGGAKITHTSGAAASGGAAATSASFDVDLAGTTLAAAGADFTIGGVTVATSKATSGSFSLDVSTLKIKESEKFTIGTATGKVEITGTADSETGAADALALIKTAFTGGKDITLGTTVYAATLDEANGKLVFTAKTAGVTAIGDGTAIAAEITNGTGAVPALGEITEGTAAATAELTEDQTLAAIKASVEKADTQFTIDGNDYTAKLNGKKLTFTAVDAGVNAPNKANIAAAITNEGTEFTEDAVTNVKAGVAEKPNENEATSASTEVAFSTLPKAGDTIKIGDTTYEFVDKADDAGKTEGSTKITIGADSAATAASFQEALADNTAITVTGREGSTVKFTTAAGEGVDITKPVTVEQKAQGLTLQIGDTADDFNQLSVAVQSMSSASLGIGDGDISVETQDKAKAAIEKIKAAINTVSSTRGDLGAIQNRLEHTINNLGVTSENMTAAESRIRDVDMAQEMMAFTKNNILTQASQSMLAQANQLPQGVLQLLQ